MDFDVANDANSRLLSLFKMFAYIILFMCKIYLEKIKLYEISTALDYKKIEKLKDQIDQLKKQIDELKKNTLN